MTALKPNLWHADEGWTRWNGGACPVHEHAVCRFQFACWRTSERTYPAWQFRWSRSGQPFDIVGYQVVGLPEEHR